MALLATISRLGQSHRDKTAFEDWLLLQ